MSNVKLAEDKSKSDKLNLDFSIANWEYKSEASKYLRFLFSFL